MQKQQSTHQPLPPGNLARNLDMALEACEALRGQLDRELSGIEEQVEEKNGVKTHIITVFNEVGAHTIGKPPGCYITMEIPPLDQQNSGAVAEVCGEKIRQLLPSLNGALMVVGLGNNQATPDALGPAVVEHTYATRHICAGKQKSGAELHPICAIAPGVLGVTGIETAEIIKGVAEHVKPAAILVVDSLAAASISRVGTTIQMADSGISPGSGVGNQRSSITAATMGMPVIAIGVPTVVNTAVIILETIEQLLAYWQEQAQVAHPPVDEPAINYVASGLLDTFQGQLMVTPKDIDQLVTDAAEIIAAGIAIAIHPGANKENYHEYLR